MDFCARDYYFRCSLSTLLWIFNTKSTVLSSVALVFYTTYTGQVRPCTKRSFNIEFRKNIWIWFDLIYLTFTHRKCPQIHYTSFLQETVLNGLFLSKISCNLHSIETNKIKKMNGWNKGKFMLKNIYLKESDSCNQKVERVHLDSLHNLHELLSVKTKIQTGNKLKCSCPPAAARTASLHLGIDSTS